MAVSKRSFVTPRLGGFARDLRRDRVALGNAVEAAQTRNLLDQILLDPDIEAVRRFVHTPAVGCRFDAIAHGRQHRMDLRVGHGNPEQPRQPGTAQAYPLFRRRGAAGRAGRLHRARLAPYDLQEERRRALDGNGRQARVHPALEPLSRIGKQPQPARTPRNGPGNKVRRLQQHVPRRIGDRRTSSPMIPASPIAPRASAMMRCPGSSTYSLSSSRVMRSPGFANLTTMPSLT